VGSGDLLPRPLSGYWLSIPCRAVDDSTDPGGWTAQSVTRVWQKGSQQGPDLGLVRDQLSLGGGIARGPSIDLHAKWQGSSKFLTIWRIARGSPSRRRLQTRLWQALLCLMRVRDRYEEAAWVGPHLRRDSMNFWINNQSRSPRGARPDSEALRYRRDSTQ